MSSSGHHRDYSVMVGSQTRFSSGLHKYDVLLVALIGESFAVVLFVSSAESAIWNDVDLEVPSSIRNLIVNRAFPLMEFSRTPI